MPARHPPPARQAIPRQTQTPDTQPVRVSHQDAKDNRVEMQVQMAVNMVEGKTRGVKFFKLRMNLRAELLAQGGPKKIIEAHADWRIAKTTGMVDQTRNHFRRQ